MRIRRWGSLLHFDTFAPKGLLGIPKRRLGAQRRWTSPFQKIIATSRPTPHLQSSALMDSDKYEGNRVPGGSVGAELRGSHLGAAVLAAGGPGSVWQDVVVRDENGSELYREGPFNGFAIGGRVSRLTAEIRREGLEAFIRRQHIENAQLGPVQAPSGNWRFPDLAYLRAWMGTVFHGKHHD